MPRHGCLTTAACILMGLVTSPVHSKEPAREFLEGLRSRGYHDTALEYLDWLATSPLAPQELRETLKFEKGLTLIAAARVQRDRRVQGSQLNQAQSELQAFIQENLEHPQVNAARSQLGHLVAERARIAVRRAERGDRQRQLEDARRLYEDAHQVYTELQENIRAQLEQIPKILDTTDREQAALAERRKQLRADYLDTLLQAAAIREETAQTHEKGSPQYEQLLTEAAARYEEIYKDYRILVGGLFARMYQARVNQKLGNFRDALGLYVELLDQPESPDAFRRLKTETMQLAMECWLHRSQRKYVEAIRRGSDWLSKAKLKENRHPDWLLLRLYLARAYKMQAEDLRQRDSRDVRTMKQSLGEARKSAEMVAKYESPHQQAARELVALLGGPDLTDEKPQPRNFGQAQQAGTNRLDAVEVSRSSVDQLLTRTAAAPENAELQQELAAARSSLAADVEEAMDYFRLAIRLANQETPISEINLVRYFLCYLYYLREEYYESALIAEFVARRYPDHAGARPCAKIALACYQALHAQSEAQEREFETSRIASIAEYIVAKWPDQKEAQEALQTLIPLMINANKLDAARDFLSQIPPDAPHRTEAELKTGKAMWQSYLRGVQLLRDAELHESEEQLAARRARLDDLKSNVPRILGAAYKRLDAAAEIDASLLTAMLSLAQAYVHNQQPQRAVDVLQHERFGPLTLLRSGHRATQLRGFAEECYRTALRANMGTLAASQTPDGVLSTAQQLMEETKLAVGNTPEGQQRLTSVYVGLAQDLQAQLKAATPEVKQRLSQGFETFLTQLGDGARELQVLNWVAETFADLGESFDTSPQLNAKAKSYYDRSAKAFQNILDRVPLSSPQTTQIQLRLAEVKRRQRNFKQALDTLTEILGRNHTALNVQVEAAHTLQAWAQAAEAGRKSALYARAIQGDVPDPQTRRNLIWGWGAIARLTAPHARFKDVFHQARFNLALCRFLQAESEQGAQQSRLLSMALKDISLTKRLYGLGNNKWRARYDELLKRIQQSKGEPTIGVKALDSVGG